MISVFTLMYGTLVGIEQPVLTSHLLQALKSLSEQFQKVKSTFTPRRRFAFQDRSQSEKVETVSQSYSDDPVDDNASRVESSRNYPRLSLQPVNHDSDTVNVAGCKAEHVVIPSLQSSDEGTHQISASISNVEDCTVDLRNRSSRNSPLAKLHVVGARRSLFLCGHVSGSVFLSESQDCALLVTSGQVRLYKCENIALYLHCTSKPVIEHSNTIKFAPLPSTLVSGRPLPCLAVEL